MEASGWRTQFPLQDAALPLWDIWDPNGSQYEPLVNAWGDVLQTDDMCKVQNQAKSKLLEAKIRAGRQKWEEFEKQAVQRLCTVVFKWAAVTFTPTD